MHILFDCNRFGSSDDAPSKRAKRLAFIKKQHYLLNKIVINYLRKSFWNVQFPCLNF